MTPHDPPSELAELSRALSREVQRREWHGQRQAAAPAAPVLGADGAQTAAPAAAASQAVQVSQPVQPEKRDQKIPVPSSLEERLAQIQAQAAQITDLTQLQAAAEACTACVLCNTRQKTVAPRINGSAGVAFVVLAPAEEARNTPLGGPAGGLLDKIVTGGMKLKPAQTALISLVQCRPPQDRPPTADEIRLCSPWAQRQLELLQAKVLVPLGAPAANALLGNNQGLETLRGHIHRPEGPPVVPTYHPQELLANPQLKAPCWKDIQLAMGELGLPTGG